MHNFYSLFLRALLAFSIAVGAPAALAGPLYRVSLDTSAFAGSTGFLDLGFNGGDSPDAIARIGNFSGAFLNEVAYLGSASGDVASGVILGNSQVENFFDQAVTFGGLFSFEVSFETNNDAYGTLFSVALFNEAMDAYLGGDIGLITINMEPGQADVLTVFAPGLAQVIQIAEVPEPGEWLLLATGLLLIGATRRGHLRG